MIVLITHIKPQLRRGGEESTEAQGFFAEGGAAPFPQGGRSIYFPDGACFIFHYFASIAPSHAFFNQSLMI
jgi:hypothetical protein